MIVTQVIGHLGQDAEVSHVNGNRVINFSVAHSEKFKDRSGQVRSNTVWVRCQFWTERNIDPYLKKGVMIFAEGVPSMYSFINKEGQPTGVFQLRVRSLELLSSSKDISQSDRQERQPERPERPSETFTPEAYNDGPDGPDDLPF